MDASIQSRNTVESWRQGKTVSMNIKTAVVVLNSASAAFAFAAAVLWFSSTWVTRKHVPKVNANGWTEGAVIEVDSKGRHIDPFASARAQGSWNRWAAFTAGFAALLQGLATALNTACS
jgi:hypothetical protein